MKLILVGLDGSERAPRVLADAVELARQTGGRLLLLRAVGVPVAMPPEAYRISPMDLPGLLEQDAQAYLDRVAGTVPVGMLAGTRVKVGTAWAVLCDVAREAGVDLIVIGAHGYGGIDRLLGTTAAKVVNHTDRSVLVVRELPRG